MKIAFHSNQLGVRGTEVALYDYAFYNREILGNESIIISDKNSDLSALEKFTNQFEVLLYDNFSQVQGWVDEYKIDAIYYIKSGLNDGKIVSNAKNLVHSVFQFYQPHGDVYAYVSNWLSNKMSNGIVPYVPHMIDINKYDHTMDYREHFGIKKDDVVFGYYGGPTSFNIEFARKAVVEVASKNPNIHFMFMNSEKFCDLPNVLFIESSTDILEKIAFINTCDGCIHARNGGESFGLTAGEFSSRNKPVITTSYCTEHLCDYAHLEMLGDKSIIYEDYDSLVEILTNFKRYKELKNDWNAYRDYTPEKVMEKFKKVFLENL